MIKLPVLVMALLALAGCGTREDSLVITGSSTIAPLMTELAERYEETAGVQVDVQSGGSGRGISDTRQGLADFGMVSRALKAEEGDLTAHLIGRDGIAMIVNALNPVTRLNDAQIVAIYTGEQQSWSAFGGNDAAINVVHKADGRSTQELFLEHFGLSNDRVKPDMVIGENQQGIKAVAGDVNAIGYVSIGTAIYEADAGAPLRLLPLSGVPATLEQVDQGHYPLSRELNLVSQGELSDAASEFLAFITDPGQAGIYHDYYFLPVSR